MTLVFYELIDLKLNKEKPKGNTKKTLKGLSMRQKLFKTAKTLQAI